MRSYGKVSPTFWTGETGKKLRASGTEAQLVALYLITGPLANMIGLYYLPIPTLCHETGLSEAEINKALARVSEASFAFYDPALELVWIPEMARFQMGDSIKRQDNRHKSIIAELNKYSKSCFCQEFYELYKDRFHLPKQVPCKPLQRGEVPHREEQEQEQNKNIPADAAAGKQSNGKRPRTQPAKGNGSHKQPTGPHHDFIRHFVTRWQSQYGANYHMAAKDGAAASKVLKAVDGDVARACELADRFLEDPDEFLERGKRTLPLLLNQINRFLATPDNAGGSQADGFVPVRPEPSELPWAKGGDDARE